MTNTNREDLRRQTRSQIDSVADQHDDVQSTSSGNRSVTKPLLVHGVAAIAVLFAVSGCAAPAQRQLDGPPSADHSTAAAQQPDVQPTLSEGNRSDRPDVPPPPPELVGRWNGGAGDSSDWWLTVDVDGTYTLINDYFGMEDSGYVDATSGRVNLVSNSGDSSVGEAAGIDGCDWEVSDLDAMTTLNFCGLGSSYLAG